MNDMRWSKYNTLFHSPRFGHFLYNAVSNVMFEFDLPHFQVTERLKDHPDYAESSGNREFITLLESKGVIVHEGDEDKILMQKKYQRNGICFNNSHLSLTICPTLACNFRCLYCFENSRDNKQIMHTETVDKLIDYITRLKSVKDISLVWFGGEPTLAFNTIKGLTEQLLSLDINYQHASMITNGYLLDREKIEQLNDLRIRDIQITLDGPAETHDRRRILPGGGPTFHKILNNVDTLMNSSYEGSCRIRVNTDKNNLNAYADLNSELMDRFKGQKLSVYAAPVDTSAAVNYDRSCSFSTGEWGDFNLRIYHSSGIIPREGLYPRTKWFNNCVANHRNSYVVGPSGELYKCWDNVGKPQMVIGNVHLEDPITNPELVALYSIATDPFDDPACLECSVLPICGGGCVNMRLKAQHFKEEGVDYCSPFRDRLVQYLEAYYNTFRVKEICRSVFGPPDDSLLQKGYRMIQPKTKQRPSA